MKCGTCKGKKALHAGNGVMVACPGCKGAGKVTMTVAEREAAKRSLALEDARAARSPSVLKLVIFGEPVPKGRPRSAIIGGKNGTKIKLRVYTPAETEAYEEKGRLVAEAEARRVGWYATKRERFTIIVRVFRTHADAGGDGDNYAKISDCLIPKKGCPGSGVIPDDRYLRAGAWAINQDAARPRLEIEVRKMARTA